MQCDRYHGSCEKPAVSDSWNIIGWMVLSAFGFFVAAFLSGVTWLIYRNITYRVRDRWYAFWCARGHHGANFIPARVAHSWHDPIANSSITEVTRFQRCLRCFTHIEGSEITETYDETDLTTLRKIHRKPKPPSMQVIEKGAGARMSKQAPMKSIWKD